MAFPPTGNGTADLPLRGGLALLSTLLPLVLLTGCGEIQDVAEDGLSLTWNGDRIEAGESVAVSDSVGGDVMLAGGEVRFTGVAGGSYVGAGGSQEIGGSVENSVRAAGGEVRLRGRVGRNATVAGGAVVLEEDATVGRNAYLAGGMVELRGDVLGSVRITGREVVLDGPVGGDVEVEAEELRLGPNARIGGSLRYRLEGGEASMAPGAEISGDVTAGLRPGEEQGGGGVLFRVLRILAFVLAGTVVVALFPGTTARLSEAVRERTFPTLGAGLLLLVVTPMIVGVLALTVLGIPLALMLAAFFGMALYLGAIPPALWLGEALLPDRPGGARGSRSARAAAFAVGGTVLAVVSFVPVVGFLVRFLFTLGGLGAAGLAVRERHQGAGG